MPLLTSFLSNPPPPSFTPSSLLDLSSKVYLITAITPTTLHLARILYTLHATVYLAFTSENQVPNPIASITTQCPTSKGTLKSLILNPTHPSSIKPAVENLLRDEWRLDILFLSHPDTNTDFLIAKLLVPRMTTTASHFCHPNPSIRVLWISSPTSASISIVPPMVKCFSSAEIRYFLAHEFANRKHAEEPGADEHAHTLPGSNPSGVQHVLVDVTLPGSSVLRSMRRLVSSAKEEEYAACTLLYAGLAPEVRSGDWVVPWGRRGEVAGDVREGTTAEEGDQSVSARVLEWYEGEVAQYAQHR